MISEVTRMYIIDILREGYLTSTFFYHGELSEDSFFSRIYNLTSLPSTDNPFANALDDIQQHCIRNDDWEWDWFYVYYNKNFSLMNDDKKFSDFLLMVFHPVVHKQTQENTKKYLEKINIVLKKDNYQLLPSKTISGHPVYEWKELKQNAETINNIDYIKKQFNSEYINDQINIMVNMADEHPNVAIGKAKELIETCAKTILQDLGVDYEVDEKNLVKLVKITYQALKIDTTSLDANGEHYRIAIKILGDLGGMTQHMSELRNEYGDGHGKDKFFKPLPPRYAHLSIGAATTIIRFIWETYEENKIHYINRVNK